MLGLQLSLPAQSTDRRDDRIALALTVQPPGVEELSAIRSGRLTRALESSEALWTFVTSSEPMYLERRAAAIQGRALVPLSWLPRIWSAIRELRAEEQIHHWRIRAHPLDSFLRSPSTDDARLSARRVLQRTWVPPAQTVDYPLTRGELERAPWPWQVHRALLDLNTALVPANAGPGERESDRAAAYLSAVLLLPCASDEEAKVFVEAAQASSHYKTVTVMGALRNIALNKSMPLAAIHVSTTFADATRLWNDPSAWWLGYAGTVDILRNTPHQEARDNAAYWLRSLRVAWRNGREDPQPVPAAAIIEAARLALDPASGDEWRRLYVYAFSIAEALDDPPFPPERGMSPASSQVKERLREFGVWYDANRAAFETLAREQAEGLAAAQRELAATSTCREP
jgi:hypothetical protein